jgi:hypothetical protein
MSKAIHRVLDNMASSDTETITGILKQTNTLDEKPVLRPRR